MATSAKTSILTTIVNDATVIWDDAKSWVETAIAKVNAVFPGFAQEAQTVEANVKQAASDVLGQAANGALDPEEKALISGVEGLADAVITAKTGGASLPLVGLTNDAINAVVNRGYQAFEAWALKAKAQLAENTANNQTATPPPPPPPAPPAEPENPS